MYVRFFGLIVNVVWIYVFVMFISFECDSWNMCLWVCSIVWMLFSLGFVMLMKVCVVRYVLLVLNVLLISL